MGNKHIKIKNLHIIIHIIKKKIQVPVIQVMLGQAGIVSSEQMFRYDSFSCFLYFVYIIRSSCHYYYHYSLFIISFSPFSRTPLLFFLIYLLEKCIIVYLSFY